MKTKAKTTMAALAQTKCNHATATSNTVMGTLWMTSLPIGNLIYCTPIFAMR
jgi:hypothetical protein